MRFVVFAGSWLALLVLAQALPEGSPRAWADDRPNIVLILADDLGFSDLGCYGSEIRTPNLDRLAAGGMRFRQFYNAARCCPTRAALLTGRYPHAVGVGHMLGNLHPPGYTDGLAADAPSIAELLGSYGYRCYHLGKWHVGGFGKQPDRNFPLERGFHRAYGTAGGGNYFRPEPLYLDRQMLTPEPDHYFTDAISNYAVRFLDEHHDQFAEQPFLVHLCYTAPHFPLQARPADIAACRGRYDQGWDALRGARYRRQIELGLIDPRWALSTRHPLAQPWHEVPEAEQAAWADRMAVHAAMIEVMDQGIGRVLEALERHGASQRTLVLFLSDNGASAEALDSWPNPRRGHRPGAALGSADSHHCLEVAWANAANTPFREFKMWVQEGGISTPLVAYWPEGIAARGEITSQVGHVIDLVPTLCELAAPPGTELPRFDGRSLVPVLRGKLLGPDAPDTQQPGERNLAWEHEGNRAIRQGRWKLVAEFQGPWQLYDLEADRTETHDLAPEQPERVAQLTAAWQSWADRVGVVPWSELPGANYRPTAGYRKRSEPPAP